MVKSNGAGAGQQKINPRPMRADLGRRMVPKVGFEPTWANAHCALNAARLPVPPLRHRRRYFTIKCRVCQLSFVQQPTNLRKHLVQHLLGQPPGLGVLAVGVVGDDQRWQRRLQAVAGSVLEGQAGEGCRLE